MKKKKIAFSFLTIGKTQESKDKQEFKRYMGVGSSFVLAVNPTKEQLDSIRGFESQNEPEYVKQTEEGKEAHIHFIVKPDPEANDGIEFFSTLMFTLRQVPAYNRDQTKVQVIDDYGNTQWADVEDAKAGKKLMSQNGNPLKIDTKYRMACQGEPDLVGFLKKYLCVQEAFEYKNSQWVLKPNASECLFKLEHVKDYFNGDFKELREALALQPNNKIKLLYGVRTSDEGKQYQTVASKVDLILANNSSNMTKLEQNLNRMKENGSFASTEFKIGPLEEYTTQPTDLSKPLSSDVDDADSDLPWS